MGARGRKNEEWQGDSRCRPIIGKGYACLEISGKELLKMSYHRSGYPCGSTGPHPHGYLRWK
jgi:hypothetical protein